MTIQEHVDISTMSSRAFESVRNYEDTMSESDRLQALEQIAGLARALEKPADAVYKLFMSVRKMAPFEDSVLIYRVQANHSYGRQNCP